MTARMLAPGTRPPKARAHLALAALALTGCALPETVHLPLPPSGSSQTVIVTVQQGARVDAFAYPVTPELRIRPPVALRAGTIALAYLPFTFEDLGLVGGRLAYPGQGRPLADFDAAYVADIAGGAATGWRAVDTLPPSLGALRVPDTPSPCGPLAITAVRLPDAAPLSAASTPSGLLVGTSQAELRLISPDEEHRLAAPASISALDRDGETIWLFGEGQLWRLDARALMGGEALAPQRVDVAPGPRLVSMVVADDGARIVGYGGDGLWLLSAGRWQRLAEFDNRDRSTSIRRWGDDVLGVRRLEPAAHLVRADGSVELVPFGDDPVGSVTRDGEDLVVGTEGGALWRSQPDGGWSLVHQGPLHLSVRSIAPFPQGLLIGSYNGRGYRWVESAGGCLPEAFQRTNSNLSDAWGYEDPVRGPGAVFAPLRQDEDPFVLFLFPD